MSTNTFVVTLNKNRLIIQNAFPFYWLNYVVRTETRTDLMTHIKAVDVLF